MLNLYFCFIMNAMHYSEMRTIKRVLCFIAFLAISLNALGQVTVQGLMTEASVTPLGIDEKKPAFTWQMKAARPRLSANCLSDCGYRWQRNSSVGFKKNQLILLTQHSLCWQSLQPATRYTWKVTVWDQTGGHPHRHHRGLKLDL